MPDWLVDPSLVNPPEAGGPPPRRDRRRSKRAAAAAVRREDSSRRRHQLAESRRDTQPGAYLLMSVLLLAVVYAAALGLPALMNRWSPGSRPADVPATAPPASTAAPTGESTTPPSAAPPSTAGSSGRPGTPAARNLSGDRLARTWLTGFLNRTDRADMSWQSAIADLTTDQVLASLRAQGPDAIGLQKLSSWRVIKIAPIAGVDHDPNTATRQTLSYAVTVSDGTHSAVKPFQLYAYRAATDEPWRIGAVHQLYSSEG